MPTFTSFVTDQWTTLPIVATSQDCKGKTYIITGANTGLGFECAKHLVALSAARVILGVRSLSKGDAAKAKIEQDTGRKNVVDVWALDLSSHASVKEFGEKIRGLDRVDVVIENAGIANMERSMAEGLETTLTVNVISTMLLAAIVLPKLQESAKKFGTSPNLVLVGSEVAFQAKGELEKIDGDILEGLNQTTVGMGKR
jgi:NAD(P)-dependent dehydrogenase (short-subunit alcohol dehydrogenase family)